MTRDEKIEFHSQIAAIERAIRLMNGAYIQTGQILVMLGTLREAWLDDEIMAHCESCGDPILTSDDGAHSGDDGWVCADCIERLDRAEARAAR